MKKILSALILTGFLAILIAPLMVSAIDAIPNSCVMRKAVDKTDCPVPPATVIYTDTTPHGVSGGMCCMLSSVNYVIDWIYFILLFIVIIFVILGAFNFVTSAGDTEKTTKGKNYILYAMIGLGIALLARAFPAVVQSIVGVTP